MTALRLWHHGNILERSRHQLNEYRTHKWSNDLHQTSQTVRFLDYCGGIIRPLHGKQPGDARDRSASIELPQKIDARF
jgi:hypothetical protein